MSEPSVLLIASALDRGEAATVARALERVRLSNASRYVVTSDRFEAPPGIRTFNAEAGYPPEPPRLETLAAWSGVPCRSDARLRDAYAFFCLQKLIAKENAFDYAIVVGGPHSVDENCAELVKETGENLFRTSSTNPSIAVVNLAHEQSDALLELMDDIYLTGAAYALSPYTLELVLRTAEAALQLTREVRDRSQTQLAW